MDDDLVIRRFTPAISQVLNVRSSDIGRPITDITSRIKSSDLAGDIDKVLGTLSQTETEVQGENNRWYMVRIAPYRTAENAIEGAVISFIDITSQKNSQDDLSVSLEYVNSILDTIREPLVVLDGELRVISINQAFARIFRTKKNKLEGKFFLKSGNGQWNIPELNTLLSEILLRDSVFEDFAVEHDIPGIGKRKIILNARRLTMEGQETPKILLAMEDITESTSED